MCGEQRYRREIRQLQHVTWELNILTGRHMCLQDDEDCSVDLGALCDYQVLNVDASDGSFSGSGFASEDGSNTCDEGGITGTTPTGTNPTGTTPTGTTPTGTTPTGTTSHIFLSG